MEFEDGVQESFHNDGGSVCSLSRGKVSHLRESVNKNQYGVISIGGSRELRNEIHGDGFPRAFGDGEGLQKSSWSLVRRFVSLARGTGGDVALNITFHLRPVVVTSEKVIGDILGEVTSCRGVMVVLEEV